MRNPEERNRDNATCANHRLHPLGSLIRNAPRTLPRRRGLGRSKKCSTLGRQTRSIMGDPIPGNASGTAPPKRRRTSSFTLRHRNSTNSTGQTFAIRHKVARGGMACRHVGALYQPPRSGGANPAEGTVGAGRPRRLLPGRAGRPRRLLPGRAGRSRRLLPGRGGPPRPPTQTRVVCPHMCVTLRSRKPRLASAATLVMAPTGRARGRAPSGAHRGLREQAGAGKADQPGDVQPATSPSITGVGTPAASPSDDTSTSALGTSSVM